MDSISTNEKKLVHEAVDERQHIRVDIPARFMISNGSNDIWYNVLEISLGGFSFSSPNKIFDEGYANTVIFEFSFGTLDIKINTTIVIIKRNKNRYSVKFKELNKEKHDVLRYFISAYLSGELINSNGIINVLQRENHVKSRNKNTNNTRTNSERIKSIIGSALYFLGALCIVSILAYKTYQYAFTVNAIHGTVEADGYTIKMPGNGYVNFMIDESTSTVAYGQPIATISTQLMTSFNTPEDFKSLSDISDINMNILLSKTLLETTLSSPCDCNISWLSGTHTRYGYKDEELLRLTDINGNVFINASFEVKDISKLNSMEKASFNIFNDPTKHQGKVVSSRIDKINSLINIKIQPDSEIPKNKIGKPATVSLLSNHYKPLIEGK